ncbi:MAG: peptidase dipeptidase [Planctomycetaceae bacterium]|nr:peptidase dipeptidase [Planctomycetaceae bacterium]
MILLRLNRVRSLLVVVALATLGTAEACASYCVYVGKNLTADGSVLLGGYGDEPSSHWLEIVPRREHPAGTMISVGATLEASYPGRLIEIPQARVTFRYITMNYSAFAGFPAPLTNGGLNEHHLAGRDVWSPSRDELRKMTPKPQTGLNYSDLSRIAMERARTSREAVEIVGGLIDKYGYATYGGNSHFFSDADEGWVFLNFAGGQKLWVAQRVGPDEVRVSRPGYIGEIPENYLTHPDFRGSPNLISFAVQKGWYDPKGGKPFNVNHVYGDGKMRHPAVELIENRLTEKAKNGKVTLRDAMSAVRTTEVTRETAGYGQVAHLRKGVHPELGILWVAGAPSSAAPFIPFRLGATSVPPEFQRHRYLTEGEAAKFQDIEQRGIESTRYAFQVYKRLLYLVQEHQDKFLPEVTEALEAFESRMIDEQESVAETARILFDAGKPELARKYLTYYSSTEALHGLQLAESLAQGIEARTKVIFGIRAPGEKPK